MPTAGPRRRTLSGLHLLLSPIMARPGGRAHQASVSKPPSRTAASDSVL